jgi:ADP-heptose:LPS heptosyltransferase
MNDNLRILIIQLFSNGDCLYATTIAKQIKHDYPGCQITWAIAEYCNTIIDNNPFVDEKIIINDITHSNPKIHWKKFMDQVNGWKKEKKFDKIYFTQIIESNLANYDYCIRSSIFRAYDMPITVDIQPVLYLAPAEINEVEDFAIRNALEDYSQIILVEFAPRSGQANFSLAKALSIAEKLVSNPKTAVILSSGTPLENLRQSIIDGSSLTLRQTAHLSKYCTLMVGCSSGITWATTSTAGKELPMIQILNFNAYWFNSVKNDHKRFGLSTESIIELQDSSDEEEIISCITEAIDKGFAYAKKNFDVEIPVQFNITRGILGYLLSRGKVSAAFKHIKINLKIFGWNYGLLKSVFLGVAAFPITNLINKIKQKNRQKIK